LRSHLVDAWNELSSVEGTLRNVKKRKGHCKHEPTTHSQQSSVSPFSRVRTKDPKDSYLGTKNKFYNKEELLIRILAGL